MSNENDLRSRAGGDAQPAPESRPSEALFQDLVETAQDLVWQCDAEGRYTYLNPAAEELFGYRVEEMLGRRFTDFQSPEQAERDSAIFSQIIEGRSLRGYETVHRRKDGRAVHLVFNAKAVRDAHGNIVGTRGSAHDVTEQRRAEAALLRSERRFSAVVQHLPMGVHRYELRPDGQLVFTGANPAADRMLGVDNSQFVGKTIEQAFPPLAQTEVPARYRTAARDGVPWFTEQVDYDEGGIRGAFEVHAFQTGTDTMAAVFLDITTRKRAEVQLRESEEKFRSIAEQLSDLIFVTDAAGTVTYVSPASRALFACEPDAMIGRHFVDFLDAGSRQRALEAFAATIARNEAATALELKMRRADGSLFFGELDATRSQAGDQFRTTGVIRDITSRIAAEAEKERLQSQLLQAQKMEAIGRLAGGVAHDFNNVLQVILGQSEAALDMLPPQGPLHECLVEIQRSAGRSADLTRQLLAYARRQTVSPKVLDLNATVSGMLRMLQRLIGEDIRLLWAPGRDLWPVRMDPSQVDQVLANLAVNARDAIDGVGTVTIETANVTVDRADLQAHPECLPGDYVVLSVSDSGRGIDDLVREHLFEPFFTTKELGRGTGLGLATVFGVVQQNAGFISVCSEPGQGTAFRLYFPRTREGMETAAPDRVPAAGGTETVLLVEDEEAILALGRRILEQRGYAVLTASSPEDALRIAATASTGIDLLITDVVMPGMNGKELSERLLAIHPGLKCLFMSGYTADVIANRGVLHEDVSFLQKPFTRETLTTVVREVLDRA